MRAVSPSGARSGQKPESSGRIAPGAAALAAFLFAASLRAQDTGAAADGDGWGSWLLAIGREPGVVEFALAAAVLSTVAIVWWRLAGLVRDARSRQALGDYLLGAEQALHGDLDGAHARLSAVVASDPENHYARLLLGKVLAERGEPEEAHKQHLCLRTAFGVDSAENDLLLARSLLAAGLPREAADAAERALAQAPDRAAAWDFVYRARLQCGDFDAALPAGRRLLELLRAGPAREQLVDDFARTLAQAGQQRLARGDANGASALLHDAQRLGGRPDALVLLAAHLDAHRQGLAPTVQALLADPRAARATGALVPAAPGRAGSPTLASGTTLPATTANANATAAPRLPAATFAGLVPESRWTCRACGVPLADRLVECPRCRATAPAELGEPRLVGELDSPLQTMDAIDVNDAHVQRLVHRWLEGTGDERRAARGELLELREVAVPGLLRAAWHANGHAQDAAIEVLRAMGPAIAPALFAASDALGNQRLVPLGSRSPAALVGRVVQGFDRTALPHVEPLFASARPEHRKILIDFFLGLADLEQFQLVLERFPPMEILHRLNKADADVLRRFLCVVPSGHFLASSLLRESTFYRDEELLAAIPGARDPGALRQVMLARGPTRSASRVLIAALADPALADVAEGVLADLGGKALEFVLAAFADPECEAEARRRLGRVLCRCGAAAASEVCDSFGPEPTAFDDDLRAILVGIGDAGVAALQAAFERSGWLEKVSIGLISRHTNRRVQIVLALRSIGSPLAAATLQSLADTERDHNLRLRLHAALHELGGEPPAGGHDGPRR